MRIIFAFILFLTLFTAGKAQDELRQAESLPLKLTLTIKETKLCVGKKFTILARMENISDKDQIIDKRLLWRYVTAKGPYEVQKTTGNDENDPAWFANALKIPRFMTSMGDNFPDDDVPKKDLAELKPKEIYKDSLTIKGADKFFRVPGEYTFWSGYGQYADWSAKGVSLFIGHIESNKLSFILPDCKKS